MAPLTESSAVRRSVFALLIVLALGSAAGRIFSTQLLFEPAIHRGANAGPEDIRRAWPAQRPEPMPTFSSNDRSRWAAIRRWWTREPTSSAGAISRPSCAALRRRSRQPIRCRLQF